MVNGVLILDDWWRGFFLFVVFYSVHAFIWRYTRLPKRLGSLLTIFVFFPVILFAGLFAAGWLPWEMLSALLLHLFLAANYIAAYPAIAARSPTVQILWGLSEHPEGLAREEILSVVGLDGALSDRLSDLTASGLARSIGDNRLALTRRGELLAAFFLHYRRFIGLPPGGG